MDLHAAQIQGFFDIPVDNLFAGPVFSKDIKDTLPGRSFTVVSPDTGGVVRARGLAKRINVPIAICDKRRERAGESEVMNIIGDVEGRFCILIDDIVDSAGTLFGIASGFTSQIAHAGQPPFQVWVVPRRLPRDILVGTTAIFFAAVNWIKVPAYVALGQFTHANLLTAAALLPVAIASTFAGVWLVRRVSAERFYVAIYLLMVLVGAKLLWDAFA